MVTLYLIGLVALTIVSTYLCTRESFSRWLYNLKGMEYKLKSREGEAGKVYYAEQVAKCLVGSFVPVMYLAIISNLYPHWSWQDFPLNCSLYIIILTAIFNCAMFLFVNIRRLVRPDKHKISQ